MTTNVRTTDSELGARWGWRRVSHDLVHRRQRFRQVVGFSLIFALTIFGRPTPHLLAWGAGVVAIGALIRLWASGCVKKNQVLATNGPYALVRHPLYVGNLLVCAGFCLASGVWWSVPVAAAVLLLFYPPAVRYEDQKLRKLFPGQWEPWAARTRALIPGAPSDSLRATWSFRQSLIENGEPIYAAIFAACLWFLYTRLQG
jgi:protein-S-isoprenylcysteine O-methyltransferase Ste14